MKVSNVYYCYYHNSVGDFHRWYILYWAYVYLLKGTDCVACPIVIDYCDRVGLCLCRMLGPFYGFGGQGDVCETISIPMTGIGRAN